jgi:Flp pilus assembly protein TadG
VEFALVGGLFFFLVLSIVNAGLFLYGRNTVEYASDVGVAMLAAEGQVASTNLPPGTPAGSYNADQVAILWMDADGLNTQPLLTVTSIAICKETQSGTTFVNNGPCDTFTYSTSGATDTDLWSPAGRYVDAAAPGPDFASLTINYNYQVVASTARFNLSDSTVFRLEPQQ